MSLRDEIFEQAQVLEELITTQKKTFDKITKHIKLPGSIFIAARGTSDNAARYAKDVWGAIN